MDIIISNASDKPIYEQIVVQMKDLILTGELQEGQQLPSIRALASDLRISVITTKRAYAELEAQGFIETVQGRVVSWRAVMPNCCAKSGCATSKSCWVPPHEKRVALASARKNCTICWM